MDNRDIIQKPFLKWVGGKTQIINEILDYYPKKINNYHEVFLGGGSILLALLSLKKNNRIEIKGKIFAYDINKILIYCYKNIQKKKDKLYDLVNKYRTNYDKIKNVSINRNPKNIEEAKTSKESYYYWIRKKFNKLKLEKPKSTKCSAMFIFLNKTCFRGMYREGPNGFNVPYGNYKKTPKMIEKKDLDNIHELIKEVIFKCRDFENSMNNIKKRDFVYLDPPYAPVNIKSFVGYTDKGFTLDKHKKLFDKIKLLNNNNVKFIMSNADVDIIEEYFIKFNIKKIEAKRSINSKKPESKTIEVIVFN